MTNPLAKLSFSCLKDMWHEGYEEAKVDFNMQCNIATVVLGIISFIAVNAYVSITGEMLVPEWYLCPGKAISFLSLMGCQALCVVRICNIGSTAYVRREIQIQEKEGQDGSGQVKDYV